MAVLLALTFSVKAKPPTPPYDVAGTYSFTVPAGVTSITVQCWGGGGAGGQVSLNSDGKGGGGGGAYTSSIVSVTPGQIYTVIVGSKGVAGTATGSTPGGQSIFRSPALVDLVIANGGFNGDNADGSGTVGLGGLVSINPDLANKSFLSFAGGNGGKGNTDFQGGGGGGGSSGSAAGSDKQAPSAIVNGADALFAKGGKGGDGADGDGGDGGDKDHKGNDGKNPGGGGGGSGDVKKKALVSGDGADGQVIISLNCPILDPKIEFASGEKDLLISSLCGTVNATNKLHISTAHDGAYNWQVSSDNKATWVNAAGPTNNKDQYELDPHYINCESVTGDYYFRVILSKDNCYAISDVIHLNVTATNNLDPGTIITNDGASACGKVHPKFKEDTPPSAGVGNYTYQWLSSTDGSNYSYINGADKAGYEPGDLKITTYFIRRVASGGCVKENDRIMITVYPLPTLSGATLTSWCAGSGAVINLTGLLPGSMSTIHYKIGGDDYSVPFISADGMGNASFTTPILPLTDNNKDLDIKDITTTNTTPNCYNNVNIDKITLIVANPTPQTITEVTPLCVGVPKTWSCTTAGGTWTSANLAVATVDATGWVTGVSAGTSAISYAVNVGGCVNTAVKTVTVNENNKILLTSATGTDSQTTCINTALTPITYSTTGATGATFTGLPTGVNGSWAANVVTISGTPTVAGAALTYTVTLTGGCGVASATGSIMVSQIPDVIATPLSQTICSGTITSIALTSNVSSSTFAWTVDVVGVSDASAASGTTIAQTLTATGTIPGTATYTITPTANGCVGTAATITVTVTPPVGIPVFTTMGLTSSREQSKETITYTATATNTTMPITYTLSPASAGTIDSGTGAVTYSSLWNGECTITAIATGCDGTKSEIHTVSSNWCYALFTVKGALSCAGVSSIDGSIGSLVGATTGFTPLTGSGPGKVSGRIDLQATDNSVQAAAQVLNAYHDLAAMPDGQELPHPFSPPIELVGDMTLSPNVYYSSGAITVKGKITLNGGVNDLFIFKINGALTTDGASEIILSGGADYRNVYWIVYGAVVLNDSKFIGTIINDGAITLNTNAKLKGRALSISGAIALTTNVVTSGCYPLISIPNNQLPTFVPPGDFAECVENLSAVDYDPINKIIIADRPDYFTFAHGNTDLDLNEALFKDDLPLTCPSKIRWEIVFSPAPKLVSPYDIETKDPITGIGQPSDITGIITFPGDGVNFTTVVHHIRWWIKDCEDKESPPQTRTITINPRPNIEKVN